MYGPVGSELQGGAMLRCSPNLESAQERAHPHSHALQETEVPTSATTSLHAKYAEDCRLLHVQSLVICR